ncbi:putative ABC transporter extracellular-binding protein YurO [Paenibacillus cisolokensis]|uniref:ABC transporter extracellular-binding protein YurO n=1 Tax=Paenibacillus cisolokensis TaxID=1658519 RepID=A0ABQ4NBC1_9BACL|nr:extracellular solute-binding protein [Paenibacillus cisolokensis]GIQ65253.1 putative ABC transporter extracellular-binding protein YurO [Paenibacillus cisolokensis]
MKTWKKLGIGLALCAAVLAGCGQDAGQTTQGSGEGAAKSEKVTLTLWHNWAGQDAKAVAMRGLLDQFSADHPNIKLEIEGLPTDGLKTRLRTAAAANEMPDLFVMWPDAMTKEFVNGDLIQPINEFLDSKPEWRDNFIPNAFDGFTVDGNIYTVPMNLAPTSLVYYNEALFEQYGVKVPETWEELKTAVKTFNENGIIPIALGNKANWVAQSTIFSSLADRVTGSEWFLKAAEQNGATFEDPQFIQALEKMQELSEMNAFQEGFNSIDETQMMQLYAQGKAAMFISGGWALSNLVSTAPEEVLNTTSITVLPAIEGGLGDPKSTSGVVGTGLGINKKLEGAELEAAQELLYWMAGPEGQKATLDSSTLVSYNIELDESKAHPLFVKLYNLMQNTAITPVYDAKLGSATVEVVNNGLQELLMGGNAQEIAKRIQVAQARAVGR